MTTFEQYWGGVEEAEIRQADFSSALINDFYRQPHLSTTLFCNRAFKLFYDARKSIGLCNDRQQKLRMTEALEDAAKSGWGSGVSDLEEVFRYIALHHLTANHWWTEDNALEYSGGSGNFFPNNVQAPEGGRHRAYLRPLNPASQGRWRDTCQIGYAFYA